MIMKIGQHIPTSVFHIIIQAGVRIGHGIMAVFTQRIGIHGIGILGTGVLHSMRGITIIHITGGMGIIIHIIVTGDLMVVIEICTHMSLVILDIKEEAVEVPLVLYDQHQIVMLDRDQYEKVFNYHVILVRQLGRLGDIVVLGIRVVASQVIAKLRVVDIILVYSSHAIGIKVQQQMVITE